MSDNPYQSAAALDRQLRSYSTLLRVWEKQYGRTSNWMVLAEDGTVVGMLSECFWRGDFFYNYRLSIMAEDSCIREALLNTSFWKERDYRFQNVDFGDVVRAFATADLEAPLVIRTRSLMIDERAPSILDTLVLAARRTFLKPATPF